MCSQDEVVSLHLHLEMRHGAERLDSLLREGQLIFRRQFGKYKDGVDPST